MARGEQHDCRRSRRDFAGMPLRHLHRRAERLLPGVGDAVHRLTRDRLRVEPVLKGAKGMPQPIARVRRSRFGGSN